MGNLDAAPIRRHPFAIEHREEITDLKAGDEAMAETEAEIERYLGAP